MRRALIVLVAGLAMPALALADTITKQNNATSIDLAQCRGAANTDPPLSDDMTLGLTWAVVASSTGNTIANGDVFRLYASSKESQAGKTISGGTGTSCILDTSGASIPALQVGSDLTETSTTITAAEDFNMAEIVTKAGLNCTDATSVPVYLCVQWLDSSSAIKGYATTSITLDRTTPPAPTDVSTSPGDGSLHLNCSGGSGSPTATAFVGKATAVDDSTDIKYSGKASSCGDVVIKGLTNNRRYSVVAFGVSANNNPSVASTATTGTPIPTDDFYKHYKNSGGQETGGCSTAAGAAGLLSALGLLALRRRKP